MPSLRSNKNKKGIPTLPVPATSVCIPVNVPDDPRWIALFLGAIYQLSQQIWYDRDAEHSAKIVADTWRDIYLETVKATWDCSGMFDLRIDPLDECSIQKTNDGETWTEVFRLDTRCTIANIRRNPYTGTLGYWDDLDFYTIPDGPWSPSMYPEFSSNPPPVTGVNKECLAATTAAYVLRNLYKTVADTLLDEVGATDWDYATNLGLALQGFLMLIGAAAMQVYVSIASLLGIVGVRQQYIDYPLDNDDEELLKCILLEHATEHSSGSVTFDFQSVWDDIDLDSPKNGLVRFLLTMIGPDALNYAGAVDAGLSADCAACGVFSFVDTFNGTALPYGVIRDDDNLPGWLGGSMTVQSSGGKDGSGLVATSYHSSFGSLAVVMLPRYVFPQNVQIKRVEYDYYFYGMGAGTGFGRILIDAATVANSGNLNNTVEYTWRTIDFTGDVAGQTVAPYLEMSRGATWSEIRIDNVFIEFELV